MPNVNQALLILPLEKWQKCSLPVIQPLSCCLVQYQVAVVLISSSHVIKQVIGGVCCEGFIITMSLSDGVCRRLAGLG